MAETAGTGTAMAQVSQSVWDIWPGLLWFGAAVVGGVVAYVVARVVRKRSLGSELGVSGTFSLAELRELRDRGELTIAEYETLKARTIEQITGRESSRLRQDAVDRKTPS